MYTSPAGNFVLDEFEPEFIELRQDNDVLAAPYKSNNLPNKIYLILVLRLPALFELGLRPAEVHRYDT